MLKKDKDRYGMQNGGPKPDFLDLDGDGNKEESMKKASEDKKEMREPKIFGGIARQAAKLLKGAKGKASESLNNKLNKVANDILNYDMPPMKKGQTVELEGIGKIEGRESKRLDSGSLEEISNMILDNGGDLNDVVRYFEKINKAQKNNKIESLNNILDEIENEFFPRTEKFDGGDIDKEMEQLRNMYEEGGEAKMIPDEQMEEQFVDFVIDEALSDKEESMLMEQLEANPELSVIFDKVIEKASEFTGAGEVEGPGTGTSDSIPARLSDGEFVFTAKAVKQLGVDYLNKMMDDAESAFDAGEDRKPMVHGGPHPEEMDDDNMSNMPQQVEMNYNINRPESVSTVNPLLAKDEEEDLISQELKKGMLGRPNIRS